MAKAVLRPTRETRVRSGHPWVFASDVDRVEGAYTPGDVVNVESSKGTFLGKAFYNPHSQIALRMLTYRDESVDHAFFQRRVETAWKYRQDFCDVNSCRLIYSESDFLPGLIVDKFSDILVIQSMSLGIEQWKKDIVEILVDVVKPRGIYERNDVPVRRLEGMEQTTGLLWGEVPDFVPMTENGILYMVDVKNGQKTGFFLDQKENRLEVMKLCRGARVLDCFCNVGGFALNAAVGGAREVVALDISEKALADVRANAELNGLSDKITTECGDVFEVLRRCRAEGQRFDVVVLDPPAFTKSAADVKAAYRGYKDINILGMKLVERGGFLVTASCSHYMTAPLFEKMLREAAYESGRTVRLVEVKTQAPDHPALLAAEETTYLKFYVLHVE